MPCIEYKKVRFKRSSQILIAQANSILNEYAEEGLSLTLRQLYYQFVARDMIKNTQQEYARLGRIIDDARLAGWIDWDSIVDRTRGLRELPHWENPADIIDSSAKGYHIDMWEHQEYRPEVWIEKDALVGVIEGVCSQYDVPYFSCRGYTSQSEMWRAAMRLKEHGENGYSPVILHFGDHDPSGKDMTRDITDRISDLFQVDFDIHRMALNMDQVRQYKPPPNPAKTTDSRYAEYIKEYGHESWELDALDPKVLRSLIERRIRQFINGTQRAADIKRMKQDKEQLGEAASRWPEVVKMLAKKKKEKKRGRRRR